MTEAAVVSKRDSLRLFVPSHFIHKGAGRLGLKWR